MGILPLKKCVNRDKCSFATKQRMFGVFAIDEILRYRGSRIPGSRTLCHPDITIIIINIINMKINAIINIVIMITIPFIIVIVIIIIQVANATNAVANVDDYSGSARLLAATTLRL